jgi:hypothetical protein
MKHIDDIRALVVMLQKSAKFHALVVESPPGWAKSSSIEAILSELSISFVSLGSYSTPLALYNALNKSPASTFVLDDSAGLFSDPCGMAVLKAATWTSAGSAGERVVTWNTTSDRASTRGFAFSGKLILLANTVPSGGDSRAFLSRTLHLSIRFDSEQIADMLKLASTNPVYFEDQQTASLVADYLSQRAATADCSSMNLRTLHLGYELAKTNPEQWQYLLDRLIPKLDPRSIAAELERSPLSVEEQSREFTRATGLSRRTFFKYRQTMQSAQVHTALVPSSNGEA